MIIRKATINDLNSILSLNKDLFIYERRFGKTYNLKWTYSKTGKEYFLHRLKSKKAVVLIALDKKNIVGYIIIYLDIYPFRSINPIGEIENMYVKKGYRNKGVGTLLAKKAIKEAKRKGAKRFKVEALVQNKNAISYYRSLGFKDFNLILEL
jgi:ribosomal protein S18 acetylase RimI-like enzyme